MNRTYVNIKGIIHRYAYDTDDMTKKPKCSKCNSRMINIFFNKLRKQIKLGFICVECNNVYIDSKYHLFKCKFSKNINKRIKG